MNRSESIKELATALSAMQGEMTNPAKNSRNPHFGNKYADLTEILDTVRPVMARHGLSVVQSPYCDADHSFVETILMHSSGEYLSGVISCKSSKDQAAQGIGSDITYLKRYQICSMLGVSAEDDLDGEQVATKPVAKLVPRTIKAVPHQEIYLHSDISQEDVETLFSEFKNVCKEGGNESFMKLWKATPKEIRARVKDDPVKMGVLQLEIKEWDIRKGLVG
jgi:ERF superfamily